VCYNTQLMETPIIHGLSIVSCPPAIWRYILVDSISATGIRKYPVAAKRLALEAFVFEMTPAFDPNLTAYSKMKNEWFETIQNRRPQTGVVSVVFAQRTARTSPGVTRNATLC
jgi:hypothetical protein